MLQLQLQVGAYLAWLVRILMIGTGIVTWPIGKQPGEGCWLGSRRRAGKEASARPARWRGWRGRIRGVSCALARRQLQSRLFGFATNCAGKVLDWVLGEESALFRCGAWQLPGRTCSAKDPTALLHERVCLPQPLLCLAACRLLRG